MARAKIDWNLNSNFIKWLNKHFREYRDNANKIVDLTFHRFIYKGKELTQIQIIDRIITLTDEIKDKDLYFWDEETTKKVDEVFELFHLVFYAMWW